MCCAAACASVILLLLVWKLQGGYVVIIKFFIISLTRKFGILIEGQNLFGNKNVNHVNLMNATGKVMVFFSLQGLWPFLFLMVIT